MAAAPRSRRGACATCFPSGLREHFARIAPAAVLPHPNSSRSWRNWSRGTPRRSLRRDLSPFVVVRQRRGSQRRCPALVAHLGSREGVAINGLFAIAHLLSTPMVTLDLHQNTNRLRW